MPAVLATSKSAIRITVRSLLRLLKTPSLAPHLQAKAVVMEQTTTPSSRYNAMQSHVLKSIRESIISSSNHTSKIRVLNRFHELQKDLHVRAELYAIDTGAENQLDAKEMSRRAAARAGLQLPIIREELRVDDMISK